MCSDIPGWSKFVVQSVRTSALIMILPSIYFTFRKPKDSISKTCFTPFFSSLYWQTVCFSAFKRAQWICSQVNNTLINNFTTAMSNISPSPLVSIWKSLFNSHLSGQFKTSNWNLKKKDVKIVVLFPHIFRHVLLLFVQNSVHPKKIFYSAIYFWGSI